MALGHDSQISTLSLTTTALSIDFFLFTFSSSCILKGLNLTYTESPTSVKCFWMKAWTGQYWSYHYIYNHCYLSFIYHMLRLIGCHTTTIHLFKTHWQILLHRYLVQICYNNKKFASSTLHIRATLETLYFPQLVHSNVPSRKKTYT